MFNFKLGNSLTSQVAPRTNIAAIVATPTRGNLRMTAAAAAIMEVDYDKVASADGLYIDIVPVDGELYAYLVPEELHNNDAVKGAKLAATGKGKGGNLLFSNLTVYGKLGGKPSSETDDTINVLWSVAPEAIEWTDEDSGAEIKFFKIEFLKEKASPRRADGTVETTDEDEIEDEE